MIVNGDRGDVDDPVGLLTPRALVLTLLDGGFPAESAARSGDDAITHAEFGEPVAWVVSGRVRAALLPRFASPRWSEVTTLTLADIDLSAGLVRGPVALSDRRAPGSKITLGPVKSRAARRTVGVPPRSSWYRGSIWPCLPAAPSALMSRARKARRCGGANFNRMTGWKYAVETAGLGNVHFHDLRHTGNTFAAASVAGIKDRMARMGHDSSGEDLPARGARGPTAITGAIDAHVEAERGEDDDGVGRRLGPGG